MAYVTKRGKIFRAGSYPERDFSITPEEMAEAVAAFSAVPIDLEHKSTILNGNLGRLVKVAQGSDPADLIGEMEIPDWLDALVGDEPIKVSAGWDRKTKRLAGLGLVLKGHIDDTAVFAAFSATQETVTAEPPAVVPAEEKHMSWTESLKNWITGGMQGEAPAPEQPATAVLNAIPAVAGFSATATVTPDPEVTALRDEVRRLTAARIQAEAVAFAEGELAAHRAYPAEREAMIAAFSQASTDDGTTGTATFSDGGSRVALLKAAFAARPAHQLTQELLKPGEGAQALFNQQTTAQAGAEKPVTAERRTELLAMSPLGQASLAARNGHSSN